MFEKPVRAFLIPGERRCGGIFLVERIRICPESRDFKDKPDTLSGFSAFPDRNAGNGKDLPGKVHPGRGSRIVIGLKNRLLGFLGDPAGIIGIRYSQYLVVYFRTDG